MPPFDFPNTPTLNQLYEPAGGPKYRWDGQGWQKVPAAAGGGGAGVTDGDKGDIVVSGSGATWLLDATVVTPAAKTLLDDTSIAAMLTTLGAVAEAPTDGALYYRRGSTAVWVKATVSTSAPSGGADGDIWYQVP